MNAWHGIRGYALTFLLQPDANRAKVKLLVATLEGLNPNARKNIRNAMSDVRPSHLLDRGLRAAAGLDPITGEVRRAISPPFEVSFLCVSPLLALIKKVRDERARKMRGYAEDTLRPTLAKDRLIIAEGEEDPLMLL